ncbi:WD repeat-containing protein 17, partial [Stegodyphus mimosarum]
MKQNFMEKAHIVSVAACENLMPALQVTDNNESIVTHTDNHYYEQLINENLKYMSERYMLCETPVKAACWYLSDDKIQDAVYCLLRGNELELAVSLCLSLGIKNSSLKMAVTYLSWRCIQKGDWDLAVDLLDLCPG